MCGLNGIISAKPIVLSSLESMTGTIAHRGPDGQGLAILGKFEGALSGQRFEHRETAHAWNVGLGHRRLAIIDLSDDGLQPFFYGPHQVLVFNGEIYNYIELREELEKLGLSFSTKTDTEVACAVLATWGEAGLHRMRGMWAMAWVDTKSGVVTLSRDRYGIKPLYFCRTSSGGLAFGSEAKQLLPFIGQKPRANLVMAADFLGYGISDHRPETFFAGVSELMAGELCTFNLQTGEFSSPRAWYQLRSTNVSGTPMQIKAEFKSIFQSSIREHLRADVPIGSCLSGGLDSSSVVATVYELDQEKRNEQLAFTFIPELEELSEQKYIVPFLRGKNIRQVQVSPRSQNLFDDIAALVFHQDFPFASTSMFAQWSVFKAARQNQVKIMLDGQGADEILGGYHSFFKMHLYSLFRSLKWRQLYAQVRALKVHGYGIRFALESVALGAMPHWLEAPLRKLTGTGCQENYFSLAKTRNPRSYSAHSIKNMADLSRDQIQRSNLPMLLRFEDRNSMAHGIEARVPFLDHRLVEYSLGLPDDLRINGGETKSILRETMSDQLPQEISRRIDKMGFVSPEETWLKQSGPQAIELLTEIQRECAVIMKPQLVTDFTDFIHGKRGYNQAFWRAICYGLWRRRFNVELPA